MPKKFSTTIKHIYYTMKMKDHAAHGYFIEYKEAKRFWDIRIAKLKPPCEGTFLIGQYLQATYLITEINKVYRSEVPEKYRDGIKTDYVYAIKCGPRLRTSIITTKSGNRPVLKRSAGDATNGPVKDERLKDGNEQ